MRVISRVAEYLKDLGNEEILANSQNWVHTQSFAQSHLAEGNSNRKLNKITYYIFHEGPAFPKFVYSSQNIVWRIVGPATDLKIQNKVVYDNVTTHVTIKSLW